VPMRGLVRLTNAWLTVWEQARGRRQRRARYPRNGEAGVSGRVGVEPVATVVILNWQRPANVRAILDCYVAYRQVAEIIVWNNNSGQTFAYDHPKVRVIHSAELGLNTRWAAALLAGCGCVIVADDDLISDEATIEGLIESYRHDPDRAYTLQGRNPTPANEYALHVEDVREPTEAMMHLTRLTCLGRGRGGAWNCPGERMVNQETPARRLRILCVCSASHWGGNEQWLSLAMAELAKRHEVYLCCGASELAARFSPGIEAFRAPLRGLWDIVTIRRLGRFVRERGIELIIATKRTEYLVCGALSRILGIKNVLRLGITRRPWIPIWHRLVYGYLNDGIIVNAERIKKTLLDHLPIRPAKVRTIRNGVAEIRPIPEPPARG